MEIRKSIKDYLPPQFYSHITENAIDIEDYTNMCLMTKARWITKKFITIVFCVKR